MEYSVSLYSFYSAIQKGELTPLGCVEKAAELGFDAVEAVDFVNFSGTQEEKKAQALELKQAAEKCGLQFSSLAIGADFLNGSDGDREKEIQRVKDYVDIAALLGAPGCATTSPPATRGKTTAAMRASSPPWPRLSGRWRTTPRPKA